MPEYKPARFRRMLAWFLDLGICLMLPARLVTELPLSANVQIFAAAFVIFGGLAAFSCRDYLLGGRSIGKRILGLSVVDRQTGEAVTGGRLVLRNLFSSSTPWTAASCSSPAGVWASGPPIPA